MAKKEGKRGRRPPSAPALRVRRIVARNVQALIEFHYKRERFKTESYRQQEVAKDSGVSWSSIQRAINPEEGTTLDVLVDLAVNFGIKPHELLNPDLAASLVTGGESLDATSG